MENRFRNLLSTQAVIVFDGAMGTMLFEHGIFINRCFDQLNLTDPELIGGIHRNYLDAGAMVIETNTFGANRFKLASFHLASKTEEINRLGAQIARQAAGDGGIVAGSVGPLGVRIEPWGPTSLDEAKQAFEEQIRGLCEGGADLVVFETFTDLAEIQQAIAAAKFIAKEKGIDLPVVASMTVDTSGNSLYGTEPEVFGPKLELWGADVVGVNCSVGPKAMLSTLERLVKVTSKPMIVMPNAGKPTEVEGRTIYISSPDYMANYARRFIQIGAQIVGGCCGTTPDHIRKIASSVRQLTAETRSLAKRKSAPPKSDPDHEEIPLGERSKLAKKLEKGKFVASIELAPPHGWGLGRIIKSAHAIQDAGFDAINIPDGPRAMARMGPLAMAAVLEREVEIETLMHYACRDRNLLGMQSDLLGAYALNLRNLLLITGDPPIMGDYPNATAVFDVDSIGLTNMVTRLNRGLDLGGRSIGKPTGFMVFVGLNPTAINIEKEIDRFRWKVDAGAHAAITQPVFDANQLLDFLGKIEDLSIPILAGLWPMQSLRNAEFLANEVPGVSIPNSLLDRMSKAHKRDEEMKEGEKIVSEIFGQVYNHVQGIQVAAPFGRVKSAIRVLQAAKEIAQVKD